jgi:C4-dicarboxylate transporter DctM subunit
MMTAEEVAVQLAEWVKCVARQPWVFLLLVNAAHLLLAIFIEPLPAMLLTAPLFMPLAQVFKIDMIHFGVMMTANLAIALYTLPVGGTAQ